MGGDWEKLAQWWGVVEGVEVGVGIDGVALVLVALSISLFFSVLGLCPRGFGCEGGLTLRFYGCLPCSNAFISPCRAVLGPSHLSNFHLPVNSEFVTGCVIWRSITCISFCLLRCCITSLIRVSSNTLCTNIVILQSHFEKEGSRDYCSFSCFCFCCCFGCWCCCFCCFYVCCCTSVLNAASLNSVRSYFW